MCLRIKNCAIILSFLLLASPLSAYASSYSISEEQLNLLEMHLIALEKNNEQLQHLLTTSETESDELMSELTKSKLELIELKKQLNATLIESEKAKKSLETANRELENASESFRILEKQKNRCEKQRNIWQIIAGGLLVSLIAK